MREVRADCTVPLMNLGDDHEAQTLEVRPPSVAASEELPVQAVRICEYDIGLRSR